MATRMRTQLENDMCTTAKALNLFHLELIDPMVRRTCVLVCPCCGMVMKLGGEGLLGLEVAWREFEGLSRVSWGQVP